ncbi:unnamed protein product [Closterium sp. Naga37s-1]|nr:unnamed protein product [Closterium sp. Naga37s-1]
MGNTMVNYSTTIDDNQIRLPYAPHRAPLTAGHSLQATRCFPSTSPLCVLSPLFGLPPSTPLLHPPSHASPHQRVSVLREPQAGVEEAGVQHGAQPVPAAHLRALRLSAMRLHAQGGACGSALRSLFLRTPRRGCGGEKGVEMWKWGSAHITNSSPQTPTHHPIPIPTPATTPSGPPPFRSRLTTAHRSAVAASHVSLPPLRWPSFLHPLTTYSKPFNTLSSTTLKYISCTDQSCQGGVEFGFYGCNAEEFPNYLNITGLLPGDDALCVYDAQSGSYDYYEGDYKANNGTGPYLESVGHVMQDTVYLTAPDGTEVNRSITLGCGVNQQGYWGMQGWQYGSWAAGGVLGLGWSSTFLWQLTGANSTRTLAVCLEATPTNETGWDGELPLQTGSSHLTIGATGLPAGASYATM